MKIDDVSLTIFTWDNIPATRYHLGSLASATSNLGLLRIHTDAGLEGHAFLLGDAPTIADVSLAGYLYYPVEEFGFDIGKDHPAIAAWRERIKALPGWVHPYELMPGHPMAA